MIAEITKTVAKQPQISADDRAKYDQIWKRLARASADLRRAEKRGDAKKIAAANRAIDRAKEARDEFLAPKVGSLWAPARIIAKFDGHWHGKSGKGIHRHECEMVLDYKGLSGPSYRTVRVLKDEGGPPTDARSAPDTMGVAWLYIQEQIKRGQIVVLGEEEPS